MRAREVLGHVSPVLSATLTLFLLCAARAHSASLSELLANPKAVIGTPREVELGQYLHEALLKSGEHGPVLVSRRVQEIFDRLAQAARRVRDLPYRVTLFGSQRVDAFAGPGGFVYVTAGLTDLLDDDELAGVLAHELVHTLESHALEQYLLLARMAELEQATGDEVSGVGAAGEFFLLLVMRGYSREQEEAADRRGIALAAAAGFDPGGLPRALHVLATLEGAPQLEFFTTHPGSGSRISRLAVEVERVRRDGPDLRASGVARSEQDGAAFFALLLALLFTLAGQ